MNKFAKQFSKEEIKRHNDEITKQLLDDLQNELTKMYQSDRYLEWLNVAALFPNYSFNNQLAILIQRPDATNVCSAGAWRKMDRFLNKGAKSIKILAPAPYKIYKEVPKLDDDGKKLYNEDGTEMTETVAIKKMWFKPVSVFDISDTNGKDLPSLSIDELKGTVEHYEVILNALEQISPVPILFQPIHDHSKGYFSPTKQCIVVKDDMDQTATIKTIIHEITHSLLHDSKQGSRIEGVDEIKAKRDKKETQAESVAYIVCRHLGIDTSEYSVGYVTSWAQDPDMKEFSKSLETISKTASEVITQLDTKIQCILQEKDKQKELILDTPEKVSLIHKIENECKQDFLPKHIHSR